MGRPECRPPRRLRSRQELAFTRADVAVILAVVFGLAVVVWAGFWVAGEKRRVWVCAHHLKKLGRAFEEYAREHNGSLPSAVFDDGTNGISWDAEIARYLAATSPRPSRPPRGGEEGEKKVAYLFQCPSDKEPRGGALRRSYSMPMYDINKAGWPPDENSPGGVGLYLDAKTLKKARDAMPDESLDSIPAIKLSTVPAPADTALLVERVSILNALWQTKYACIIGTREQFDAKTIERKKFHGGRMNYLMLDGHVELLWPGQSEGFAGASGGVWTMRAGD